MKKVNRNPEKPYEDMDGNWIGLWKGKDKWDRNEGVAYPRYNKRKIWGSAYKNPDMEKGELEKTYNTVIDDENHVFYDYYSDSLVNFLAIKETRLDNKGRVFIEAILDGQDRLLEKNVFYYDQNERIVEVKKYDMIRKNVSEDYKIPVQVHTYEYD